MSYRTNLEIENLAIRSKLIADEQNKINEQVIFIKAKKNVAKFLKDIFKKIGKASNNGQYYIDYEPFCLFNKWNSISMQLVATELINLNFKISTGFPMRISWSEKDIQQTNHCPPGL